MNTVLIIFFSVISSFSESAFILTFHNKDPERYINEKSYNVNRVQFRPKYYKKKVDLSFTTSTITSEPLEKEYTYIKTHRSNPRTSTQHKSMYYRVLTDAAFKNRVLKMGSPKSISCTDPPKLPLPQNKYKNIKRIPSQENKVTTRIMSSSGAYRQEFVYPKTYHIPNHKSNHVSPVFKGETCRNVEQMKPITGKVPKSVAQELYTKLAQKLKQSGLWSKSRHGERKKNKTRRLPTSFDEPVLKFAPEFTKSAEKIILSKRYDDTMYVKPMKKPDPNYPNGAHPEDDTSIADTMYKSVRILCYVLTEPKNHNKTLYPIKETWGRKCNKLLFMSTVEDPRIPTIKLQVTSDLYKSWQKVMAAYLYVHDKYKNEFEWFLRADDDSYIIMENIRYLLAWFTPEELIYFGCRYRSFGGQQLKDGHGPGMILSRAALKAVVAGIRGKACKQFKFSDPAGEEFGICLDRVGVQKVHTRDGSGGHRFLPAAPEDHVAPIVAGPNFWYWMDTHYPVSQGASCCSDYAIAFHNITPVNMYGLEYLIYRLRPFGIKFSSAKLPYSSTPNTKSVSCSNIQKKQENTFTDINKDYGEDTNGTDSTDDQIKTATAENPALVKPLPQQIAMNEVQAYNRKRNLDKKRILRNGHTRKKKL